MKRTRKWVKGLGWLYSGGQGGPEGGPEGGAAAEEEAAASSTVLMSSSSSRRSVRQVDRPLGEEAPGREEEVR